MPGVLLDTVMLDVVELPDNWAGKLQEYCVALLTPVTDTAADVPVQKETDEMLPPLGLAIPVQVYWVAGEILQPDPVGLVLIQMLLLPTEAVIVGTVALKPDEPLTVLYSKTCVPAPPLPKTGLVRVRLVPAHTVVVVGDWVAVGAAASALTVINSTVEVTDAQSVPSAPTMTR